MTYPKYAPDVVIKRAFQIQARQPPYSQGRGARDNFKNRGIYMNDDAFDCSSFIAAITGYSQEFHEAPATPSMRELYSNNYNYIPMDFHIGMKMQAGDILVWNWSKSASGGAGSEGHTALCLGPKYNNDIIEMTSPTVAYGGWRNLGSRTKGESWTFILRNPKAGIYIEHWSPTDGIQDGF